MKKKLLISTIITSLILSTSSALAAEKLNTTENAQIVVTQNTNQPSPLLWAEGVFNLDTMEWTLVALEVGNLLTANVNITSHSYDGEYKIEYKIVHNNGNVYKGTVSNDTTITHKGIPKGGYKVYARAYSHSGSYGIIVDDWIS